MPFQKGNKLGRRSRIHNTPEENAASAAHARSFINPEVQSAAASANGKALMASETGARIRAIGLKARVTVGNPKQGKINAESGHCKRITQLLDHSVLGTWSSHQRWHVQRARVNPHCEHCITNEPPETFRK